MAMFIRVKRKKTTYFLHCDPTETILEIKQKIQALSENPVDCQRLILMSTQQILEDNKTLADQKTLQSKVLVEARAPAADENAAALQGVLLQDAKTLAEQQVENDAIVALCLKISDPRVHRIPTLMRQPIPLPTRSPTPPPPEEVEEIVLAPGEEAPPPPPPSPPAHRMSTELRVPYRPPSEKKDIEFGDKEGSLGGNSSKKDPSQKDSTKKEAQKEGVKKEVKKDTATKDVSKKETSNKEADKKQGKDTPGKAGKQSSKKGSKKGPKEEVPPPPEEIVGPPEDDGVWEDITIDKLTDYSTLVDSD